MKRLFLKGLFLIIIWCTFLASCLTQYFQLNFLSPTFHFSLFSLPTLFSQPYVMSSAIVLLCLASVLWFCHAIYWGWLFLGGAFIVGASTLDAQLQGWFFLGVVVFFMNCRFFKEQVLNERLVYWLFQLGYVASFIGMINSQWLSTNTLEQVLLGKTGSIVSHPSVAVLCSDILTYGLLCMGVWIPYFLIKKRYLTFTIVSAIVFHGATFCLFGYSWQLLLGGLGLVYIMSPFWAQINDKPLLSLEWSRETFKPVLIVICFLFLFPYSQCFNFNSPFMYISQIKAQSFKTRLYLENQETQIKIPIYLTKEISTQQRQQMYNDPAAFLSYFQTLSRTQVTHIMNIPLLSPRADAFLRNYPFFMGQYRRFVEKNNPGHTLTQVAYEN